MRCAVPGCGRERTTRDTCWAHYLHGRRHAAPETCVICAVHAAWTPEVYDAGVCGVRGCLDPYFALGMCQRHYRAERRSRGLDQETQRQR